MRWLARELDTDTYVHVMEQVHYIQRHVLTYHISQMKWIGYIKKLIGTGDIAFTLLLFCCIMYFIYNIKVNWYWRYCIHSSVVLLYYIFHKLYQTVRSNASCWSRKKTYSYNEQQYIERC